MKAEHASQRQLAAKRLAAARQRAGLTQRELAAGVGVTDRAVQSWERGRTRFYRYGRPLAAMLEVDADWLLALDEVPPALPRDAASAGTEETAVAPFHLRSAREVQSRSLDVRRVTLDDVASAVAELRDRVERLEAKLAERESSGDD